MTNQFALQTQLHQFSRKQWQKHGLSKKGCDIDIVCHPFSVGWGGLVEDKQEKKEKEKKEREVYQNGKLIKK